MFSLCAAECMSKTPFFNQLTRFAISCVAAKQIDEAKVAFEELLMLVLFVFCFSFYCYVRFTTKNDRYLCFKNTFNKICCDRLSPEHPGILYNCACVEALHSNTQNAVKFYYYYFVATPFYFNISIHSLTQ